MKRRVVGVAVLGLGGLIGSSALAAAPAQYQRPGHTERISVASSGAQAHYPTGAGGCGTNYGGQDLSDDGRYLVFASDADNLVPGDTNQVCDVFRVDRQTGRIARVSLTSTGAQGVSNPLGTGAGTPSVSADGRYIAFRSDMINLVPGDTNLKVDVFVRDMLRNTTRRVSTSSTGAQGNTDAYGANISANGEAVGFASDSTNLVPGDTNDQGDAFVKNLKTGVLSRVSVSSSGAQATGGYSSAPELSADGRYVTFNSRATNLVPGNTTQQLCNCAATDVYWRDTRAGTTKRVSVASDGAQASYAVFPTCNLPGGTLLCYSDGVGGRTISADGRYVIFESTASNLVPNDTNFNMSYSYGSDVFLHDAITNRTERISGDAYGHERAQGGFGGLISASGRYATFGGLFERSCSDNLKVPLPDGLPPAVTSEVEGLLGEFQCTDQPSYVTDRLAGSVDEASARASGVQSGDCGGPGDGAFGPRSYPGMPSRDGRYVFFVSGAPNLVAGDTNKHCDYFLRDRGLQVGASTYAGSAPTTTSGGSSQNCVLSICPIPSQAALLAGRISARPAMGDLFVRWDLRSLSVGSLSSSTSTLYGLEFSARGEHYQVRAQRVAGPDLDAVGGASFGLFHETLPGVWTHVASLKGGYGTVGDAVVTAVPLSLLAGNSRLTDVTAFTALGSYLSGPTQVLDSLRLSR